MNFWKRLRLIGSALVVVLGIAAAVGAWMRSEPPASSPPSTRDTTVLPGQPGNGTRGL